MAAVSRKQQRQQPDPLNLVQPNSTKSNINYSSSSGNSSGVNSTMAVSTRNPLLQSACSSTLHVSDNNLSESNTTNPASNVASSGPTAIPSWATPTLALPQTAVLIDSRAQTAPDRPGYSAQLGHPELHLHTNVDTIMTSSSSNSIQIPKPRPSAAALSRSNSFQSSLSPNSAAGSPSLSAYLAIGDITPLPSPILGSDSPGPWRLLNRTGSFSSRPTSRGSLSSINSNYLRDSPSTSSLGYGNGDNVSTPTNVSPPQTKRKAYQGLSYPAPAPDHLFPRINTAGVLGSRSVSEQLPTTGASLVVPHQNRIVDGIHDASPPAEGFKREEFLAGKHGFPSGHKRRPSSVKEKDDKATSTESIVSGEPENYVEQFEYTARTYPGNNKRHWRGIKLLGQGTFSRVMLATSEKHNISQDDLSPDKLVAIKIIENGAAGGASKSRIESSLKRELDILKSIKHPSLVHLKAFGVESARALLVLTYCPGGDLFDFATTHMTLLTPQLVRRMFAELVGALIYLHKQGIVHRDVKLENVLINLTPAELATLDLDNLTTYTRSVTTLTDLGLSRRVDFDKDPLLTTRCGSEDYAAPELLLAQPYDGRQTDAWALGVLLYSLMESRLPFDPMPGAAEHKMRSRTAHKIARCDWKWVKLADPKPGVTTEEEMDAWVGYDEAWKPAKEVVDMFLRRVKKRVTLEEVSKLEWVAGAILNGLDEPLDVEDL